MNISSLLRELLGPRPLRRGVGLQIAHLESGTLAFFLESQPTFTTAGGGKGGKPTSAAPYAGVTSTLNSPVLLVHAMGKFSGIERLSNKRKPRLVEQI